MIALFAYSFPHRKTHDFLCEIRACGVEEVVVFAAPFEKLLNVDRTVYINRTLRTASPLPTGELCRALGYRCFQIRHDDVEGIREIQRSTSFSLGIISGARILRSGVIDIFSDGIVNFHPGPLPETSGLDAFFYSIKNNVDAGVTTHFIDKRIDAGRRVAFDAVTMGLEDTPEIVQENSYNLQITALRRFLRLWKEGRISTEQVDRPKRNQPMSSDEKWDVLRSFPEWRASRYQAQQLEGLARACEAGDLETVQRILRVAPHLIDAPVKNGWSPLIIAAFNQHKQVVETLLEMGADPNSCGKKGTTVLMYAKSALVGQADPDLSLLELLIGRGADPKRCDMFGRRVLDYVENDPTLGSFFSRYGAA